ncbi:AP-3 complex subunit delta-like [Schistocerca gregaria]|uniref:AP-3 complex subunit delta-like n=1 Tax=Schistocerca gregaria TaxID=7010 RepID=UPI00211E1264|nr:AP-3 complex subunit delta-like [Schistocerca gregaria]
MYGIDISWAAFKIIEQMAQKNIEIKRASYFAANVSISEDNELLLLMINIVKKDLLNSDLSVFSLAVNCLSNLCPESMARVVFPDLQTLLTSSRAYVRKRTVLALCKVFKIQDILAFNFSCLKERLEDSDQTVVSAALGTVCELASKNPKDYVILAPVLFKILSSSKQYWNLIKVVMIFTYIMPCEPRLAKKLAPTLSGILESTPSSTLAFECIKCCISNLSHIDFVVNQCINKLDTMCTSEDVNFKYLMLVALTGFVRTKPSALSHFSGVLFELLDHCDYVISTRALNIIVHMADEETLTDIVKKLLEYYHRAEPAKKRPMVLKIVFVCSQRNYALLKDFEWYFDVLFELALSDDLNQLVLIRDQLLDITMRVESLRPYAVKKCVAFLNRPISIDEYKRDFGEILGVLTWIIGEYVALFKNPEILLNFLLQSYVYHLSEHIQAIYVQTAFKIFAQLTSVEGDHSSALLQIEQFLRPLLQTPHFELQERSCFLSNVISLYREDGGDFSQLFSPPLRPVSSIAQSQVPVPEGLNLDASDEDNSALLSDIKETLNDYAREQLNRDGRFSAFYLQSSTDGQHIAPSKSDRTTGSDDAGAFSDPILITSDDCSSSGPDTDAVIRNIDLEQLKQKRKAYMLSKANNPEYIQSESSPPIEPISAEALGIKPGERAFSEFSEALSFDLEATQIGQMPKIREDVISKSAEHPILQDDMPAGAVIDSTGPSATGVFSSLEFSSSTSPVSRPRTSTKEKSRKRRGKNDLDK